jgi:hypothetical protein
MHPRSVALIAAACLSTGWLLASLVSPPVAELQVLPERTRPRAEREQPAAVDAPYTEQLHLRLQQLPVAPVPRRNPFVFGGRARVVSAPVAATDANAAEPETSVVSGPITRLATGPALRLSGIGSSDTPQGPVRTAVISDGSSVYLVKVGETVNGYSVVDVTEDSVTLTKAAGAQWVLRVK